MTTPKPPSSNPDVIPMTPGGPSKPAPLVPGTNRNSDPAARNTDPVDPRPAAPAVAQRPAVAPRPAVQQRAPMGPAVNPRAAARAQQNQMLARAKAARPAVSPAVRPTPAAPAIAQRPPSSNPDVVPMTPPNTQPSSNPHVEPMTPPRPPAQVQTSAPAVAQKPRFNGGYGSQVTPGAFNMRNNLR